jgi:hypothetical protein
VFFKELLSAGYGLLPGRLPGSCGYLGCEVFMSVSGRSSRNERKKNLHGANDSVCSGTTNFIGDWRSAGNPEPVDNIVRVLCSGCNRNLKSGTQCETCGRWYHNSCGNVKFNLRRVENGTVTDVDLRDSGFWKRN